MGNPRPSGYNILAHQCDQNRFSRTPSFCDLNHGKGRKAPKPLLQKEEAEKLFGVTKVCGERGVCWATWALGPTWATASHGPLPWARPVGHRSPLGHCARPPRPRAFFCFLQENCFLLCFYWKTSKSAKKCRKITKMPNQFC